ncbi:aminoacyl-tRNA hydrolase [Lacicoccus alkaliphilus]|uniref:Peptidyl-tRNA hydrolase n=1 Tax=Lacicoccus alkaliphilus DSM 16010 TaxID=1123231 RepID=A0A1M7K383_9BACL|nr:aminoacyl-tRNA hydrolase [Salinicoccus alkaliphilus]SHM59750.1 peptidyl-tRNA hydrolase, PTH1 family [Salinicoccus alkaliphilus DSM 16010]
MRCIIGLGNPGKKYELTRHNVGFMAIDEIASGLNIELSNHKFKCNYGIGVHEGHKVMLVKPQTFMNLSGEGVRPLLDYYNIDLEKVLVLYDDLDLPLGRLRLRKKGTGGGHNGMKSLNQHLKTENYKRIRIGIDRPSGGMPVVKYVLSKFSSEEQPRLEKVVERTGEASISFISEPFEEVMTKFNGDVDG